MAGLYQHSARFRDVDLKSVLLTEYAARFAPLHPQYLGAVITMARNAQAHRFSDNERLPSVETEAASRQIDYLYLEFATIGVDQGGYDRGSYSSWPFLLLFFHWAPGKLRGLLDLSAAGRLPGVNRQPKALPSSYAGQNPSAPQLRLARHSRPAIP